MKTQTITDANGFKASFEIDPFRKFCLLEGFDDIGLTLRHDAALDAFEAKHNEADWLKAKSNDHVTTAKRAREHNDHRRQAQ